MIVKGEDPAAKEDYAGRDIRSVPLAVDRLNRIAIANMRISLRGAAVHSDMLEWNAAGTLRLDVAGLHRLPCPAGGYA